MSGWYGTARTNYVRLAPGVTEEALRAHIAQIGLNIEIGASCGTEDVSYFFHPGESTDDGDFPSWLYPNVPDRDESPEEFAALAKALGVTEDDLEDDLDSGGDVEFSWEQHIMPFIAENEVLVVVIAGAEKLRYVTGFAQALIRRGDEVSTTTIRLSGIYSKAAQEFGVALESISGATY